jgi:hypothetical protein
MKRVDAAASEVVVSMGQEFPQVIAWLAPLLSEPDFAFVAGSRVAGLGNAGSDYDLIPVFAGAVPDSLQRRAGARLPRLVMSPANQLLNVEDALTLDDAEAIRLEIEALDTGDASRLLDPRLPLRLDTYLRFCIGLPAINSDAFQREASGFDLAVYKRAAAAWLAVSCQKALTEARFWSRNGQNDAVRIGLEQALSYAVGFHLLACGEVYRPWERWRYEELQRCKGVSAEFSEKAWNLKAVGARELPEYQEAVEAFCLGTIDEAARFQGHLIISVQAMRDVRVFPLDDDFYLVKNGSYVFRLTHPEPAEVWASLETGYEVAALPLVGSFVDQAGDGVPPFEIDINLPLEMERSGLVEIRLDYSEEASSTQAVTVPIGGARLERVEMSPGQLVLSRLYGHLIRGGFFSRPWATVMAAMRVEQWGIAVVRARDAVRGAVDAALALNGAAIAVDLRHRRGALLEAMGPDGPELAAGYCEIELQNPITPEEVAAYIQRCGAFTGRMLAGFPINAREAELSLDERHTLLLASIENAARLAAELGIKAPLSLDAASSTIAFRETVAVGSRERGI